MKSTGSGHGKRLNSAVWPQPDRLDRLGRWNRTLASMATPGQSTKKNGQAWPDRFGQWKRTAPMKGSKMHTHDAPASVQLSYYSIILLTSPTFCLLYIMKGLPLKVSLAVPPRRGIKCKSGSRHCLILLKFARQVHYGYTEAAEWLKSISVKYKRADTIPIRSYCYNSAVHCPIVVKFVRLVHYGFTEPSPWLSSQMTCRMGGLKLQCGVSRHLFTALHAMQMRYCDENSVRLSVRLSVTRVICDKMEESSVQIYIPYERTFISLLWEEEWLVGGNPFYLKFWVNRPPLERNRRFSTNNRS